ncbi:MAG: NAD(P)H-dependent oxidoreductase subunit E, partial [Armatimonadota bacterium]
MSAVETSAILEKYAGDRSALIRALQEVQEAYNYLPRESIEATAEHLQVPVSEVLRVATFFKAFSLEPRGKHVVQVCQGTA